MVIAARENARRSFQKSELDAVLKRTSPDNRRIVNCGVLRVGYYTEGWRRCSAPGCRAGKRFASRRGVLLAPAWRIKHGERHRNRKGRRQRIQRQGLEEG